MKPFAVNLVTAFGRGESLALALKAEGFDVTVLDFTSAFPTEYRRGPGPFPIALKERLPAQKEWLQQARPLDRGVCFWLEEGPLELSGPMADFYSQTRVDVQNLRKNQKAVEFKTDWLRRFLNQWASPFQSDAWQLNSPSGSSFPSDEPLGLIPVQEEEHVMSFAKYRELGHTFVSCQSVRDVQVDGLKILEIAVEAGQALAFRADQWVWCLSSRETEILNSTLAQQIFSKGIWRPDWSWVSFNIHSEHGPWVEGFPQHSILIGDVCLPWVYANMAVLRRLPSDGFRVWIKVPSKQIGDLEIRQRWASELETLMNQRLKLAKWKVDSDKWGICPNSPVFNESHSEWGVPSWKNWDWISPETLPRLDLSIRLDGEAKSYERVMRVRTEELKKLGAEQ